MKISMRKIFFDELARRRVQTLHDYMTLRTGQPYMMCIDDIIKNTRGEEAMKEVTIDGRKYRLVEDEKPVLNFDNFKLVPDRAMDELDLFYDGHRVISLTRGGKYRAAGGLPRDVGFCTRNGCIEEEED